MHADIVILSLISLLIGFQIYRILKMPEKKKEKDPAWENDKKVVVKEDIPQPFKKELEQLSYLDDSFTPDAFGLQTQKSFELISKYYYMGDVKNLRPLVGDEVFGVFEASLQKNARLGLKASFELVRFLKTQIKEITLVGKTVQVKVLFETEQISHTRAGDGKLIAGSDEKIQKVSDIWIFFKDYNRPRSSFLLIKTQK